MFEQERRRMVEAQLLARGIRDPAVLAAMSTVPREKFLPDDRRHLAYVDAPVGIGWGQTISQPYIVALMAAALALGPQDRVLEVGAGSGYAAAILASIAREVYTIERLEPLADRARDRLRALGFAGVHLRHGDGTRGWPERAPFDAIVVAAGGPCVPPTLLEQLTTAGRLVMPVGRTSDAQRLVRVTREEAGEFRREDLGSVSFVPLIGDQGWHAGADDDPGAPPGEMR